MLFKCYVLDFPEGPTVLLHHVNTYYKLQHLNTQCVQYDTSCEYFIFGPYPQK